MPSREAPNKAFLVLAFAAGIGGIVFLKLQNPPLEWFWTVGWPVGVLLVYGLPMWVINDKRLYEIIGDNCYYLGFVFTLTSLAVTLYLLYGTDGGGPKDEELVGEVISGFGIALSSTIVGIVLRVLMLRMTSDIVQQENEARVDLDIAVRDFRTHLRMSVGELKRHSVEAGQALAEQRDSILAALAKDADAHRQALEKGVAALARFSGETEKGLSDHRAALREGMQQDAGAFRQAAQEGAAAFRKAMGDAAVALSQPEAELRDALRRSLENHKRLLEDGAEELRGVLEQAMEALAGYREAAQQGAGDFRKAMGDAAAALSEPEAAARETFRRSIETHRQILEGGAADLGRVLKEAAEAFAAQRDEAGRLAGLSREASEQTRKGAEAAREELASLTALTADLSGLSRESRGLDAVLSGLTGKLERVEGGIAADLEPAVARIGEGAIAISAALADSSGKLQRAVERFESAAERTAAADTQTNIAVAVERLEDANRALAEAVVKLGDLADRPAEPRQTGILGGMFGTRNR